MKKDIAFSLSLQKEIQQKRLCLESEVEKSCVEVGIKTLLHRTGISKEMPSRDFRRGSSKNPSRFFCVGVRAYLKNRGYFSFDIAGSQKKTP